MALIFCAVTAVESLAVEGVYVLIVSGVTNLPLSVYVGQSSNIAGRVEQWVAYWAKPPRNGTAKLVRAFEVTTGVSGARAQKFVREFVEQTVLNEVRELAEKEGVNVLNKVNPI